MRFTTIFFDLDDTLYPANSGLWLAIKERMNVYMREKLNIPAAQVADLREKYYMQFGTTTRGLQEYHDLDTQDFLSYVHDLPLQDYLTPNPDLRRIIASLPTRNLIFTNADIHHADRVLKTLELRDLFELIVDVNAVAPYCKPMPDAFKLAMNLAGETDPRNCVMIDDLTRTTRAARELGMFSLLMNESFSNGDADAPLNDWAELHDILERQ
ncbi:pyrimidine 5'-nucleotidase [Chloroflexota bacterium]